MDAVLAGIFRMSLDLLVEPGEGVGLGKLRPEYPIIGRNFGSSAEQATPRGDSIVD